MQFRELFGSRVPLVFVGRFELLDKAIFMPTPPDDDSDENKDDDETELQ